LFDRAAAAYDPKWTFSAINCRIAKGSFDRLVNVNEQAG